MGIIALVAALHSSKRRVFCRIFDLRVVVL